MYVIFLTIHSQRIIIGIINNAGDVLVQPIPKMVCDDIFPAFDGKYRMDVDLCVGVCHSVGFVSPLRGLV